MISIIILTKNEEKNILACIESVAWADELIVVDSRSTDKTIDIAKEVGAKIFLRDFTNFSEQRNFAIDQCRGDWIFYLDADERPSKGFEAEFRAIEKSANNTIKAYRIDRLEYFMGDFILHGGFGLNQHNHHLRLWKKGSLKFSGDVHEKIITSQPSLRMKSHILHYSNEGNISGFITKLNNYTAIEAIEFSRLPGISSKQSLILIPLKKLIGRYIFMGGFRDGLRGLIFILLHFFYDSVSSAKKIEKSINLSRSV